jgi:hypothetical protein
MAMILKKTRDHWWGLYSLALTSGVIGQNYELRPERDTQREKFTLPEMLVLGRPTFTNRQ